MKKIDYGIGGLVGFFAGVAMVPTAYAVGVHSPAILLALPWVGAACILFGVWLGGFLSRWMPVFAQLGKFGAVGIFNTAIDFGVLNLLSRASGITAGFILGGVNMPGFAIAVVNSYLFNKLWVFKDNTKGEPFMHDFPRFFAVTFIGVMLNSGLVIFLTTYAPFLSGITPSVRLNLAKASATIVTLVWNFLGYKLIVFRKSSQVE
ncbi:MAG: GtrA family protein [Candidatus Sungiibacteriota bacterium]